MSQETKKEEPKEIVDCTKETCSDKQAILECQKLCSYVAKLCGIDMFEMMSEYKLNNENIVHLVGLTGNIIGDIIIRDMKKMSEKLKEITGSSYIKTSDVADVNGLLEIPEEDQSLSQGNVS